MIRVLIADDHRLFRIGLKKMLREAGDIKVVGEARNGEEAVAAAREMAPNVVLMDHCAVANDPNDLVGSVSFVPDTMVFDDPFFIV